MNKKLIDKFILYLKLERRLSTNTCSSYQSDLFQFDQFLKKNIKDITKKELDSYIEYLHKAYKESTYLRKIAALKSFNKYLINYNLGGNQHIELLEAKKREKRMPKFLTQDQIDIFLNQLSDESPSKSRDKAMFETLYSTGVRVSEIIKIKVTDVNLENGIIKVLGKGNKERVVILNQTSIDSLDTYIKKHRVKLMKKTTDFLFLNNNGNPLTRQGFSYILKRYAKQVGINDISPHIFRHSIATHMLNNGGDLRMIQMVLGHANIATTEIYTHVSKEKVLKEYGNKHPLAKEEYEKN